MALCVMPRSRAITLHCINGSGNGHNLTWDDNGADNGEIWIKVRLSAAALWRDRWEKTPRVRPFKVKPLMLTPMMVREVERNLLLWRAGRAAVMNDRRTTRPMRLLTRLVESGHEVAVSHVLTILGGPMERMADWGDKRRRPCIVRFEYKVWHYHPTLQERVRRTSAMLGSVKNIRAITNSACKYAY